MELQPGDRVPEATVLGPGDRELRLSELWSKGPALLVFLRHFG